MKQRYSKRKYYLPVGVSCGWWPQPPVCLGTSDPGEADPLLGDDQLGVLRGEGDRGPHRGERGGGRHQPWKYRRKIDTFFGCETLGFVYRFAAVNGFGKPGKSAAAAAITLTTQGEMCI